MSYNLDRFVEECRATIKVCESPAHCVSKITPLMYKLLQGDRSFLEPQHFQTDESGYCRNAIHVEDELGLFSLVWKQNQWTPIHDHGTWGVVGVLQGVLQETSYMRADAQPPKVNEGIDLVFGNVVMLSPGTVTSFVPNPDHIHQTGNSFEEVTVSLHLYGHAMSGYNQYDKDNHTREYIEVSHN